MSQSEPNDNGIGTSAPPQLDISRLHTLPSEQQDLYLLSFSADLARETESINDDKLPLHQGHIKKEILKIILLSSPPPSRAIRNNLGRSFAGLFRTGDRKLLYESVNELLVIVNAGKGERPPIAKHAAIHCLGEIFEVAGDSIIALSTFTGQSIVRLHKSAQDNAGLRSSIFRALGKVFSHVGASVDEPLARDVWKLARGSLTTEKSYLVQKNALWCLEQLVTSTSHFDSTSDFENFKATVFRLLDTTAPKVRHAAASTLASVLIKYFSGEVHTDPKLKSKKAKKLSKKESTEPNGEDEAQRSEAVPSKKQPVRTVLSLSDILKQLSAQYVRASTSNKARAGLAVCYIRLLKGLSRSAVETHYMTIADHLLTGLLSHHSVTSDRYRLLITRKFVRVILENVVNQQILGETAQLSAAKALVNNVVKNYPQVIKERAEPSKHAITGALSALKSLLESLGSAANSFADSCRDGLLQVLQHPSYTVQISTSHCLRTFALVCPQQLLPCASVCLNSVKREINLLKTPRYSHRRCVGFANGLAAVLSTSLDRPIYGSMDVTLRVLSLANDLLKSSGDFDLRTSATQIQVAWIMMGGLMALGPNFVKTILHQLLLLWKNALPKPQSKESMEERSPLELSFLTHVRECSLGCMLAFLEFNSRILTNDLVRRMATLLQNTTLFLNHLPSRKNTEDIAQQISPSLQLYDLELMVRRRVLQCYTMLLNSSPLSAREALLQPDILTLSVSLFAHPEDYTSASLSTSIANSAGNFESVWEVGDNHGFGVTGLLRGLELQTGLQEQAAATERHWLVRKGADARIDYTLLSPISGAREHDSVSLYVTSVENYNGLPDPPSTEVINSAIRLFAVSLPLQSAPVQESILEQLLSFISATGLYRDSGRRAAVTVNVAVALLITLKVAAKETVSASGDLTGAAVERTLYDLLRGLILHQDVFVRNVACEALGRLCSSSGNTFTANAINQLIEVIVSNREPNARAGCSLALGCIHFHVGGMAASYHVKTIFGILLSLSDDPHPLVHFWALEALQMVIESAGLTFSGYVSSTLGMLAQRYVNDTHNEEVPSSISSNLEMAFPTTAVIANCLDSLVNVLGPDLSDAKKVRELILTLTVQLQAEDDPLAIVGNLKCLEHIAMYASEHIDFTTYVRRLQLDLSAPQIEIRDEAIDGLYNLVKLDAERVIRSTKEGFEEQIWLALDGAPGHYGLRNIIKSWLRQTCLSDTVVWIQRCQRAMNQTRSSTQDMITDANPVAVPDLQDEEVAGFATAAVDEQETSTIARGSEQELLKWQVRAFAIDCLSELLDIVSNDMLVSESITAASVALQGRVADVIRIAFSASTSHMVELRIWGLRIIEQVLKMFGKTPDPDFPEASLLDQYQAQISSALTPAFAADSSPELAAEAIEVCAAFIATGIVTDVDRMGRILKLLVSALKDFSAQSEMSSIGDLVGLSANAQMMVKLAVISAWAGLQVASKEQTYLVDVVRPHKDVLTPLWLSALREYGRLRFAPSNFLHSSSSPLSGEVDTSSADIDLAIKLKFYKDSWLKLMQAIAGLVEENIDKVFDSLDGRLGGAVSGDLWNGNGINHREEPVAFFFVLFGIVFQALLARVGNDVESTRSETVELLVVFKKLLRPSVSGQAIYQEAVFSEIMDLLNRLVLTQSLGVQHVIVEIARDLCVSHPSSSGEQSSSLGDDTLSEDIEQLFELARIIVMVLAGLLPNLAESNPPRVSLQISSEAASLIQISLKALVSAAEVFPAVIKTDLYACIFHIFTTIIGIGVCQATIVPQALQSLKHFVQAITKPVDRVMIDEVVAAELRSCLKRLLSILANAQKRETSTSLACVKNTLLALTILVTSGTRAFSVDDPLIDGLLDEMVDCLTDRMTARVAANCIRSLLLNTPRTPIDEHIIRSLVPRLIAFTINLPITSSPSSSEGKEDPEHELARSLIAQSLTTLASSNITPPEPPSSSSSLSPAENTSNYLLTRLLVPALIHRATLAQTKEIYKETASRLIELAEPNQAAFRHLVGEMSVGMRTDLETVFRKGSATERRHGGVDDDDDDDDEDDDAEDGQETGADGDKPSIALKLDFGR